MAEEEQEHNTLSFFAREGSPNKTPREQDTLVPLVQTAIDTRIADKDQYIRKLQRQVLLQQDVITELQAELEDARADVDRQKEKLHRRERLNQAQRETLEFTEKQLEDALRQLGDARKEVKFSEYKAHLTSGQRMRELKEITWKMGLERLKSSQENRDRARLLESLESEVTQVNFRRKQEVDELTQHVKVLIGDRTDLVARLRASAADERTYERWHAMDEGLR